MPCSSKYPEQFRNDAAELVLPSDRPLRQVARELGVNHETPRKLGQCRQEEAHRRAYRR